MKHAVGWLLALSACSSPRTPAPATPEAPAVPAAATGPAPAKIEEVVDTVHGTKVRDPYRWMEKGGPALDAFLDAQAAYARTTLAAIPGRDQLRDALRSALRGRPGVNVDSVMGSHARPRVFLYKAALDDASAQFYVRDGWDGKDRVLVDPRTRNHDDVHHSIDFAVPSPDGKHVAYGTSKSGSEDSTIEILEVDGGKVLPEKIDRAQYAGINWRDNKSFFYWRRRAAAPGDTRADWFKYSASYLHVLGDDPERAKPVFALAMAELGVAPTGFTHVSASPRSAWLVAAASPGTSADPQCFVAPLAKTAPGKTPWRRISGPADKIRALAARGNTLYASSYDGAPRFQILALDAAKGTLATAKVFVAESAALIDDFVLADDAMYVSFFDGGVHHIERITYDGKKREPVQLPFEGTVTIAGEADRPGILLTIEGWSRPAADFAFDPKHGMRDLALRVPWPIDYAHVTTELVEVTSADGTKVPMSIIYRKDARRDGSAPAFLNSYAAYGFVDRPEFSPPALMWADRGGVFAICHGRGTGNRGKQWHLDGIKHNKERGVDDYIACAEYLVANKYTAPARLTVAGASAGGILAGGAITKRPELYAAAVLQVPMANLVRFEITEGGPVNVPELGSLADEADWKAIFASDPYHRLVDGTKYPAMLITGGKHDVRVPIWQQAKFAARAQAATRSGKPVILRVESGAGHGLGSTRTQIEEEWADLFAFALWQSGVPIAR